MNRRSLLKSLFVLPFVVPIALKAKQCACDGSGWVLIYKRGDNETWRTCDCYRGMELQGKGYRVMKIEWVEDISDDNNKGASS